ncbi:MAG: MTH1187 family thiamine-binding protein [Halobacteriaceae archaeon]
MPVIAALSVTPLGEADIDEEVAKAVDALEAFDVSYETHAMETTIEAPDMETLLAAVGAAHAAVDADRVSTLLKVDDRRTGTRTAADKVAAVRDRLGREPRGHPSDAE